MALRDATGRLIFFFLIVLFHTGQTSGQTPVVGIDTSEYLPLFYDGALEFNLIIASSKGYSSEIERLISLGAEVDPETSEGATPLIIAVANNMSEAVKILLLNYADVNKVTMLNETALMIAVKNRNVEITESLIRYGAELDFQDRSGVTVLNYASGKGFTEIVDLLLYYGADMERKARDGTTPLTAAIWAGYADIADLLIRSGANMEARDNEGFTPFLTAAQNGDTLILGLLYRNGVDIYEKNFYNWDALNLAIKSDHREAVEYLIKIGERWRNKDGISINPYNVAARYRRKEIIELLDRNNFPDRYNPKIDQMAIGLSSRFNMKDCYSGFGITFKEPLKNIGIIAGFDTKLWQTRVLVEGPENIIYQYFDKSSAVYAGLFKEFSLTDNLYKSNISFSTSLSAAYTFGNKYQGTDLAPESKFRIMPAVNFKWSINNMIIIWGMELLATDYLKIGPVWSRVGLSYNFNFDYLTSPGKVIKW